MKCLKLFLIKVRESHNHNKTNLTKENLDIFISENAINDNEVSGNKYFY